MGNRIANLLVLEHWRYRLKVSSVCSPEPALCAETIPAHRETYHLRTFSIPALILSSFCQILPSLQSNNKDTLLPLTKYHLLFCFFLLQQSKHTETSLGLQFPKLCEGVQFPLRDNQVSRNNLFISLCFLEVSPLPTPLLLVISSSLSPKYSGTCRYWMNEKSSLASLRFQKAQPPSLPPSSGFSATGGKGNVSYCLWNDSARKEKWRRKNREGGGKREVVCGNFG